MASDNFLVQWLVLAFALLTTGCLIAFSIDKEHGQIEKREQERLATQARVIDENLTHQLGGIYRALIYIRNDLPTLRSKKDLQSTNHRLMAMADAMPDISTFLVTDAAGTVIACNRKEIIGRNVSQREYFQKPLLHLDQATLHVSPPFWTVLNNFVINLSLMIPGPSGKFDGVVSAALDPEYFKVLLGSVHYAPDMWTVLSHGDGRLFLIVPEQQGVAGLDLSKPGTLFSRHRKSGLSSTVLTGSTLVSDETRMMAQHIVKPASLPMDKPLVVAVTRDISALYAHWRTDSLGKVSLFLVLLLTSALSLHLYQQRQRKFEAVSADYEAEQLVYAERLRLATEAAGVGVWDYELESGKLTWDNAMFEIFDKDPDTFSSTYADWRNCVLPEDLEGVETLLREAINNGHPFTTSFHIRRNGGSVRIVRVMARVHLNESGRPVA